MGDDLMEPNLPTFIFIAGHHRSGTSLLHDIVKSHNEIEGFCNTNSPKQEGQHLQTLVLPAHALGGWKNYIFNEQSHMNEHHPLATKDTSQQLIEQWSKYCKFNLKFFVEKSPPNLVRTRFFQALFPDSKFIITRRHPIAVACALCASDNPRASITSVLKVIDHILLGYEIAEKDTPHLKNVLSIRYEDIILNSQQVVDTVFDFIGVPSMVPEIKLYKDLNHKYFSVWKTHYQNECGDISALEERANVFNYSLAV